MPSASVGDRERRERREMPGGEGKLQNELGPSPWLF
jgi:hypothetical protein